MTAIVVWVVVWSDFAIAAGIGVLAMALLLGLLWIVMTTCNRVENRIKENDTAQVILVYIKAKKQKICPLVEIVGK